MTEEREETVTRGEKAKKMEREELREREQHNSYRKAY